MLKNMKCCQVDAIVTVDGRGQVVLPKEVREKLGVKAGDKFVVISSAAEGKACCLFFVKADEFTETVKDMLGPMVREIVK